MSQKAQPGTAVPHEHCRPKCFVKFLNRIVETQLCCVSVWCAYKPEAQQTET